MDKAVKIPLIALSVITTQLVVLLGNTTMSKSAQYKPNQNENAKITYKQIPQSYYDRQIKIESIPVMYEQEKPSELMSQSFSDQWNKKDQSETQRRLKCDQQTEYYKKIGYAGGVYYIGKNNEVYKWSSSRCESTLKGYVDGRTWMGRTTYVGKDIVEGGGPCDYTSYVGGDVVKSSGCDQWKLEKLQHNGEVILCRYTRSRDGSVSKYCP